MLLLLDNTTMELFESSPFENVPEVDVAVFNVKLLVRLFGIVGLVAIVKFTLFFSFSFSNCF